MNFSLEKKLFTFLITLSIVTSLLSSSFALENSNQVTIGGVTAASLPSQADGSVNIVGETQNQKIKVMVKKGDYQEWFDLDLTDGKFNKTIWLIRGKGSYEISIMVHIKDRTYSFGPSFTVENTKDINRFIVPTNLVESDNSEIVVLSKDITKNLQTDREKAQSIYNWVTKNIKYDYEKYRKQNNNDYSSTYGALNTLKTHKGVCYDFSLLVAALGRASGIEIKVIKGNFLTNPGKELHAWNEVYLTEEKKWINLDTTFGYALGKNYFDNDDFYSNHEKLDEY